MPSVLVNPFTFGKVVIRPDQWGETATASVIPHISVVIAVMLEIDDDHPHARSIRKHAEHLWDRVSNVIWAAHRSGLVRKETMS